MEEERRGYRGGGRGDGYGLYGNATKLVDAYVDHAAPAPSPIFGRLDFYPWATEMSDN